jgi:hypothetical protein
MVATFRNVSNAHDMQAAVQEMLYDAPLAAFTSVDIDNVAGVTLTAAQMLSGMIFRSGAAAVSDTTPTAAALIAAMGTPPNGTSRLIVIRNANSDTLTLLAGTTVTITGTATIATLTTAIYILRKTSSTAVTLTRLMAAAY